MGNVEPQKAGEKRTGNCSPKNAKKSYLKAIGEKQIATAKSEFELKKKRGFPG